MTKLKTALYILGILTVSSSTMSQPVLTFDTAYNTGAVPLFIKSSDFDEDGLPDLAVANYESENIHFFYNNGNGKFSPTRAFDARGIPSGLELGDVNGDGFTDLVVPCFPDFKFVIFQNLGTGLFQGGIEFANSGAYSLTVGQLDDNNGDDIVVVTPFSSMYIFFHSNDLEFSGIGPISGRRLPISMEVVDLDNDGLGDIAISNSGHPQYFYTVLWNQGGSFTFNPAPLDIGGGGGVPIISGDLNSDGLADLAVSRDNPYSSPNIISILINQGGRHFDFPIDYAFEGGITDAAFADFNGDNKIDLAGVNLGVNPYLSIFPNLGNGNLGERIDLSIEHSGYGMTTADFDCDNDMDVALTWPYENKIAIYLNNSSKEISDMLPNRLFAAMAHPIYPTPGLLTLENFTNGHRASDIDTLSIKINDSIIPSTFSILYPDYGPCDKLIRAEFSLSDFVAGYGVLWDTTVQSYSVTGQYLDGDEFSIQGEVTLIGHRSGDLNRDGQVGIQDLTIQIEYIFRGGEAPTPLEAGDIDGICGTPNIGDLTYMVDYLFRSGPNPTHNCRN